MCAFGKCISVGVVLAGVLAVLGSILHGCGGGEPRAVQSTGDASAAIRAVATTGMIADVVREVGGQRVEVKGLMGEGVDPHLYKASPGDVRAMSDADIIFYNGLHLEGRMADVIVKMAGTGTGSRRRTVVRVTDAIDEGRLREPEEFEGHYDPHVWFDVSLWSPVAGRVAGALSEADPEGKPGYEARAAAYTSLLNELHAYASATLASIPESRRVLVTAHDAFGYFGAAYGIEVLAIQGISTDSEASLKGINALVDTLVSRRIPAVFIESSVPRKTVDALIEGCKARGHTVTIGGELFSDAAGPAGTLEGTYVGMVLHNVDTITRALGGVVPEIKPGPLGAYVSRWSDATKRNK